MEKEGESLSLNTIVVAAIALIVFLVVTIIFLNRTGHTNKEINECLSKGGECIPKRYCTQEKGVIISADCSNAVAVQKNDRTGFTWAFLGSEMVCCINME